MTDLTVLVSPIPLYPETKEFIFGKRPVRPLTPIMVTLETEIDQEADKGASKAESSVNDCDFIDPPASKRRIRTPTAVDSNLLSPPTNTWRAKPKHRPTRSQSAPPERRLLPAVSQEDQLLEFSNLEGNSSAVVLGRTLKRSSTPTLSSRPVTRVGELLRPPPPLFRPTTFWRKTRRSGVTGASYSPSSHLIRRSTYIAAGLAFDAPFHDLSALCVESRPPRAHLMRYLRTWPNLVLFMRITVALAVETDTILMGSSHLGFDGRHILRQASVSAAITTTIDPSSVIAPTLAPLPSVTSSPTIVIPFLSPSTTTTSIFLSTSALASVLSSQNTTSSIPAHPLSSTSSPTPSAQNTGPQSSFKFVYLIPAIALVGIFLGSLTGWIVYGCMTRKPRVHKDDGTLLIGPRYIGINEPEHHSALSDDITQMKNLPESIRASSHFRWPSFSERPTFHPVQGPEGYLHNNDSFLATRPGMNVNVRTKSTRPTSTSKSPPIFKPKRPTTAGPSRRVLSSRPSDATSLALLELYESDEEEETRRKAQEVPWERLRHKSIKRGIIEQVKKEGKWMESIRSLAGSTLLGSRPEAIMEEDNVLLGAPDIDDSMEVDSYVGRQRGYSVPDSDPFADSPTRISRISPKKRPVATSRRTDSTTMSFPASSEHRGFQIISEPAVTALDHSPSRSFTWIKKDDKSHALKKLTRTSTVQDRKQGQSLSRSNSPAKRTLNDSLSVSQAPRRDVLPQSPAQIMSPPLHSQICFTSIPTSLANVQSRSSTDYHYKSSPTKPLMASTKRKAQQSPHHVSRLPKPILSANRVNIEVSRLQNTKQVAADSTETHILEDPIKKVERIMASSWSARDLGQGGMRSLSPTGFGRGLQ